MLQPYAGHSIVWEEKGQREWRWSAGNKGAIVKRGRWSTTYRSALLGDLLVEVGLPAVLAKGVAARQLRALGARHVAEADLARDGAALGGGLGEGSVCVCKQPGSV